MCIYAYTKVTFVLKRIANWGGVELLYMADLLMPNKKMTYNYFRRSHKKNRE